MNNVIVVSRFRQKPDVSERINLCALIAMRRFGT